MLSPNLGKCIWKFGQVSSIRSEDIEQKRNFDNNQGP